MAKAQKESGGKEVAASRPPPKTLSKRELGRRNRVALVDAARLAFHAQGIKGTTIANIAERAGIPVGNIYYYFRTKQAFARGVIDSYRAEMSAALAALPDTPREALLGYVAWSLRAPSQLAAQGCPRAALVADLVRVQSDLAAEARALVADEVVFVSKHVGEERIALAEDLVAQVHGIKALTHALGDREVALRRGEQLAGWIRARIR